MKKGFQFPRNPRDRFYRVACIASGDSRLNPRKLYVRSTNQTAGTWLLRRVWVRLQAQGRRFGRNSPWNGPYSGRAVALLGLPPIPGPVVVRPRRAARPP